MVKQAPSFTIDEDDKQEGKIEIKGEGEEFSDEEEEETKDSTSSIILEEKTEADLK